MHSEPNHRCRLRSATMIMSALMVLMILGLAGQGGCTRTLAADSAVDYFPAPDDELDYWDALETRRALTVNDAFHGLLLFDDPDAAYESYEARLAAARERGWISERAQPDPNESATLGMVSVAICEMLDIKGGLTMRLIGNTPRYATRELIYLRMLPDRTDFQALSGLEFTDLLRKAEARRQDRPPLIVELLDSIVEETDHSDDANDAAEFPDATIDEEGEDQ